MTKQNVGFFFLQFLAILAPQNTNFEHWRPQNEFLGHLEQNKILDFFAVIFNFAPRPLPLQILVIGPLNDLLGHLEQNKI